MSAICISIKPGLFNWLQQSPVLRFILPGTMSSGYPSRQFKTSVSHNRESDDSLYRISDSIGKTALITGATSGIGKEFAYNFARRGYDLIITGRRKHKISLVASRLRNRFHVRVDVIIADLSARNDLHRLLKFIENRKNIEVLVNNAGSPPSHIVCTPAIPPGINVGSTVTSISFDNSSAHTPPTDVTFLT